MFKFDDVQSSSQAFYKFALPYVIHFVEAFLILIIGWFAAKIIHRVTKRLLSNKRFDKTVATFFGDIIYYVVLVIVLIAFLSKLGIQTTSLAAVLGATALAVGYSLKGSISQFTSGLILVSTHPFRVGHSVKIDGTMGKVKKVSLMFTVLTSFDNQEIIIPNNKVLSAQITNFTVNKTRRINLIVGIGYDDDIDKAKAILTSIAESDDRILHDPAPKIVVKELGDSSVNMLFRVWVKNDDFAQTQFDCTEIIKKRFDAEGVSIPFPQRDVHVIQPTNAG